MASPASHPAIAALAAPVIEPSKHTDQANAERFVTAHKGDVRWVETWKQWLYYDGRRWMKDDSRQVEKYAQAVIRSIYAEAARESDPDKRARCAKWAVSSDRNDKHKVMLERAKPLLSARADDFDTNPDLLNCLNGTVDLRTGAIQPHDPGDMITKLVHYDYNPSATCPTWEKHLELVLPTPEIREFLQVALGYSSTGRASERKFFYCYGTGLNGKSVTLNATQDVLDEYSMTASPTLLVREKNRHVDRRAIAELRGKRFVVTIDQQEAGQKLSEAMLKMVASNDRITGQRLYQAQETFTPTHTVWMSANSLLVIAETSDAVWDRIIQIPFTVRIPEKKIDPDIDRKLAKEREGILAWLIAGAVEWYANGLVIPDAVRDATSAYREDMDLFGSFLDECTESAPGNSVSRADLMRRYQTWCKENNYHPWVAKTVVREMRERGYGETKVAGMRHWTGIAVGKPAFAGFGDQA